jgi:hypothetical protein
MDLRGSIPIPSLPGPPCDQWQAFVRQLAG